MTVETIRGRRAGRVAVIAAFAAVAAIGVGGERWASAGEGDGGGAVALADSAPSVIVPLAPARILDTRTGVGAPAGRVVPGSTFTLQVSGVGGVPVEAIGVVLNLTATVADGAGYVTAYPAGGAKPDASVINYSAGEDVANMVTAQLGAGGALAIFNDQANVHLLADVAGYLVPGSGAVGPQGPQGPAGPGASLIATSVGYSDSVDIGTWGGVRVVASCASNQTSFQFEAVPLGNNLVMAGIGMAGITPLIYDIGGGTVETLTQADPIGPIHYSGLIGNSSLGTTYQLELHMSTVDPCAVRGSIIPVG